MHLARSAVRLMTGLLAGFLSSCQNPLTMNDNPVRKAPATDFYGEPTVELAAAIRDHDVSTTQRLLNTGRYDLGDRGERDMPLTLYASAVGNFDGLRQLLAAGASANDVCDIGHGPMSLLEVAVGSKDDRFMETLMDFGASPNGVPGTDPPIFRAIMAEEWGRMEKLLAAGADINRIDSGGRPPIRVLALLNKYDKVLFLLERGADPDVGIETKNDLVSIMEVFPLSPSTDAGEWQQRVRVFLKERKVRN